MRARRASLAFILITVFLDVLGIGLVIPVFPQLVTELTGGDVSDGSRMYGLFIAAYATMQFLFAPLLGALSDRFGRRPVLLVSLFGAGVDYLVLAVAPTLAWLFVARLIAGVTAANITVANAYIADVTAPQDRARNFGLLGAMFGLGFIVAPAIGGVLGSVGLRVPFYAAAAVVLANWLYGYFVLPESLPAEKRRAFAWERADPLRAVAALRRFAGVLDLAGVLFAANLANVALQSVWVLYTGYRFGWGPLENGLSLTVVGVLSVFVQAVLLRPVLARLGEWRTLTLGLAAGAVSLTLYGLATEPWMLLATMALGALGGLAGPAAQGLVSRAVSDQEQGSAQGAIASLASLTAIVSPLAATFVFAYATRSDAGWTLPGAPFFLGALLFAVAFALSRRAARRAGRPPAGPAPQPEAAPEPDAAAAPAWGAPTSVAAVL
jgi:MFS transporter, DHA1 family, tetracycline resistance protein